MSVDGVSNSKRWSLLAKVLTWTATIPIVLAIAAGVLFLLSVGLEQAYAVAPTCECPQVACSPCERQVHIEFYTEKCTKENGSEGVRSCKRPTCKAIVPEPANCPSVAGRSDRGINKSSKSKGPRVKIVKKKSAAKPIGVVVIARGQTWVKGSEGKKTGKMGLKVYEKDTLETGKNGQLKVQFYDKNILNVTPDSKVTITTQNYDPVRNRKRTLLNLIYGKIRSKLKQKYDGAKNTYKIKTRAAVAGVRGTDFVTSYSEDEKSTTKIQTLHGEVEFSGNGLKKKASIKAGKYASFVIDNFPKEGVFDEEDIGRFVARGYLTPVYEMTEKEIKQLKWETDFFQDEIRGPASDNEKICKAPSASLNQCSWTCENNPPGALRCRTDKSGVRCVRRRCNANGKWAEQTRLPASYSSACDPQEVIVKSCDY